MAEQPETLLLEYMRRFDARQARFEDVFLRRSQAIFAIMHGDLARHRGEIETIKSRLDRIERHLDLADAPT